MKLIMLKNNSNLEIEKDKRGKYKESTHMEIDGQNNKVYRSDNTLQNWHK